VPLNKEQEIDGHGMMELYEQDTHMKEFCPIIKNSPVYPVILDAKNSVLSVPPIINSDKTKITKQTKNVFIESTATDHTRALQGLNVIVSAFSQYCTNGFTVEEVEVHYPDSVEITPNLKQLEFTITIDDVKRLGTFDIKIEEA
jgi:phenylalanyl-tRNA synthetase beta chain